MPRPFPTTLPTAVGQRIVDLAAARELRSWKAIGDAVGMPWKTLHGIARLPGRNLGDGSAHALAIWDGSFDAAGWQALADLDRHPCACDCGRLTGFKFLQGHFVRALTDRQREHLRANQRNGRRNYLKSATLEKRQHDKAALVAGIAAVKGTPAYVDQKRRSQKGLTQTMTMQHGPRWRTYLARKPRPTLRGRTFSEVTLASMRRAARKRVDKMGRSYYQALLQIRPTSTPMELLAIAVRFDDSAVTDLVEARLLHGRHHPPVFAGDLEGFVRDLKADLTPKQLAAKRKVSLATAYNLKAAVQLSK